MVDAGGRVGGGAEGLAALRGRLRRGCEERLRLYDEGLAAWPAGGPEHGAGAASRLAFERSVREEALGELRPELLRHCRRAGAGRDGAGLTVLALLAAHLASPERLGRFEHALRSIERQVPPPAGVGLVVSISWYAGPDIGEEEVLRLLGELALPRGAGGLLAARQPEPLSQFEHLRAALSAAQGSCAATQPVWVIFGDDDDLWHSGRVAEYAGALAAHRQLGSVAALATTARAVVISSEADGSGMPADEAQVDALLARGGAALVSGGEFGRDWAAQLRRTGADADALRVPEDHELEYFDFCVRADIFREFLEATSPKVLAHRLCDLWLVEFLLDYPARGLELGLAVSFFEPRCWMYFYANALPSDQDWVEALDGEGSGTQFGRGDHVSNKVQVREGDQTAARGAHGALARFQPGLTEARLARYLAYFRYCMELALIKLHGRRIDQRDFDRLVFAAVQCSFVGYLEALGASASAAWDTEAGDLLHRACQSHAAGLLDDLGVSVLWLCPGEFLTPVVPGFVDLGSAPEQPLERVSYLVALSGEHHEEGDYAAAARAAEEATALAATLGDPEALGAALVALASSHLRLGRCALALREAERAEPLLAASAGPPAARVARDIAEAAREAAAVAGAA